MTETVRGKSGDVEMVSAARPATFEEAAEWYEFASSGHFWFEWRLAALRRMLAHVGLPLDRPARVLDIGCGTGVLRNQLEACTPWVVDGADLNLPALEAAPPGRGSVLYYDIEELHSRFVAAYDFVTCCDVIEHIDDTRPFMRAVAEHVKPGGLLLLSVPALPGLHSAYDEAAGHVRRYTADTLAAECEDLALDVLDVRYWGFAMVPLLWLRKLWVKPRAGDVSVLREGFVPPGDLAHAVLRAIMRIEIALLHRPPLGSSVMLVARRRTADA